MGIGVGIFLLALGAILAFAVTSTNIAGLDIHIIGYILMAAGVLDIALFLLVFMPRDRRDTVVRDTYARDRDVYRDPARDPARDRDDYRY